ncbi:hypothetical protein D3C72_1398760 [compost metagenome]
MSSGWAHRAPSRMGTSRCSISKYVQNFFQQICTGPVTRFGLEVSSPFALRFCCQLRFNAKPPNIAASLDPTQEVPIELFTSGACHNPASIFVQHTSIFAVSGYNSLSIRFFTDPSFISSSTSGSDQVVQNVAKFCFSLPSSIKRSLIKFKTELGQLDDSGIFPSDKVC